VFLEGVCFGDEKAFVHLVAHTFRSVEAVSYPSNDCVEVFTGSFPLIFLGLQSVFTFLVTFR
jgi:hypothetical protein